ncbi:MAG: Smr/MutS family protein [Caulobacteraceae bacterium]|nr:Smr/MutS family protein [Caulobacteraceae bacterium]
MKRPLRPEELLLWSKVTATIRPAASHALPAAPPVPVEPPTKPESAQAKVKAVTGMPTAPPALPKGYVPPPRPSPRPIEPGRMRRLTREREDLGPRLDLHGLNQDEARTRLIAFLRRAHDDGWRAAMVITGKGSRGDGVLRRYAPEWLAAPELRDVVAGVAEAHRRHGGAGALYVALKRRVRE